MFFGHFIQLAFATQVKLQQGLATIEEKYGDEMMTAGAMVAKPKCIHDTPAMAVASMSDAAKPKADGEVAVLRSGPITLTLAGDVDASAAQAGQMLGHAGNKAPSSAAKSSEKQDRAYDVDVSVCTAACYPGTQGFGERLFESMCELRLLEAHLEAFASVCKHV